MLKSRKFSLFFASFVAILLPWVYWAATPLITRGVWPQAEPVMVGHYALGALAVVALGGLAFFYKALVRRSLLHPVSLVFGAIGGWLCLMSLFQVQPVQGLWGSQEFGEGALFYLALWPIFSLVYALTRGRWLRQILLGNALFAILALGYLVWQQPWGFYYTPFYFPDYLAFYGLFAFALVVLLLPQSKIIAPLVGGGLGAGFLLLSGNRAAEAFFVLAFVPVALMAFVPFFKKHWGLFAKLAVVGGTLLVAGVLFQGKALLDQHFDGSLKSRLFISEAFVEALSQNPSKALVGFGAGSYPDIQVRYFPAESTTFAGKEGAYRWEGVDRHHFHTHNQFLELMLSGGIVPALLLIFFYWALLVNLRPHMKHWGGYTILSLALLWSVWFQMPTSWGMMALVLVCFMKNARASIPFVHVGKLPKGALPVAVGSSFVALSVSAVLAANIMLTIPPKSYPALEQTGQCEDVYQDYGWGRWHFVKLMRSYAAYLKNGVQGVDKDQKINNIELGRLFYFLCLADQYQNTEEVQARLKVNVLNVYADMAFAILPEASPAQQAKIRTYLQPWEGRLLNFIDYAPVRMDMAAPYLLWLVERQDFGALNRVLAVLSEHHADHVITRWFSGLALLLDERSTQQESLRGIDILRGALRDGIDRFIPVDADLRAVL